MSRRQQPTLPLTGAGVGNSADPSADPGAEAQTAAMDAPDEAERAAEIEAAARTLHANSSLNWMRWDQIDPEVAQEMREKARRAVSASQCGP